MTLNDENGMPRQLPSFRKMSDEELLEEFALASLKKVTSDTNDQERAWGKRWFEVYREIFSRME